MRSVSAIAIDLTEGSNTPGEFSGLLARLEQTLHDVTRENGDQPRLVPLRVVITFGSTALNAADDDRGQETLAALHSLDQFPPEPSERTPERVVGRSPRVLPPVETSMFTYVSSTPPAASLPPELPAGRPAGRRQGYYGYYQPPPNTHYDYSSFVRVSRRLLHSVSQWLRQLATMGLSQYAEVRPAPWISQLQSLRLRPLLLPCVAIVLVGIQSGGLPISAVTTAPAVPKQATVSQASDARVPPFQSVAVKTLPRPPAGTKTVASDAKTLTSAAKATPRVTAPAVRSPTPLTQPQSQPAARQAPAAPPFVGSLLVDSQPAGAQVFMNRKPIGVSPLVLSNVPAGAYALQIEVDGYSRWSRGIYVVMNQETRVTAQLERERR